MLESVDTLERAIVVLKRGQTSFLQRGAPPPQDLQLLLQSLSKVVSAAWVTSTQRAAVKALLMQGKEATEAEDEDLTLQPQATVAAYESKGSSILDVLGEMQGKAEEALSDARKTEME